MSDLPPKSVAEPGAPAPSKAAVGAIWLTVAVLCGVIALGAVFVTQSYRSRLVKQLEADAASGRPRIFSRLEKDLEGVNRDGKTVSLGQLKGKIYVLAHQYTTCPSGCLGVAYRLADVHREFGNREGFHIVSVSVDPGTDTPEKMDAFVKNAGIDAPNWWFLTGDETEIRRFMVRWAMFFGTKENTDPAEIASVGKYSHDLRVALIDGEAHVRGQYELYDEKRGDDELKRLRRDINFLYEEREEKKTAAVPAQAGTTAAPAAAGTGSPTTSATP